MTSILFFFVMFIQKCAKYHFHKKVFIGCLEFAVGVKSVSVCEHVFLFKKTQKDAHRAFAGLLD